MKIKTKRIAKRAINQARYAAMVTILVLTTLVVGGYGLTQAAIAAYEFKMAHGIDVIPNYDTLPDEQIQNWIKSFRLIFSF